MSSTYSSQRTWDAPPTTAEPAGSAAYSVTVEANRDKHLDDMALLASMLAARDLRGAELSKGERRYLAGALPHAREHPAIDDIPGAADGLDRLALLLGGRTGARLLDDEREHALAALRPFTQTDAMLRAWWA